VDGSAGSPMEWPARGSLSGDQAYVQRAASWLAERASTDSNRLEASDINVLYAGDVARKRLIIGAYRGEGTPRPVQIVSLAGDAGSDQKLTESPVPWTNRSPTFDHLVAFLLPAEAGKRDQRATVVVLPDSSVEALTYSRYRTIPPSGGGARSWAALIDEDGEPGVVTGRIDGEVAPGALRIAATWGAGGEGTVTRPEDFSGADDYPRTALREMAEQAAGDRFIGELAPALQMLEMSRLGREQITSVRIPWRFDRDGEWVGLELGLAGGGTVEAVLSTAHPLTFEGTGRAQETVIYAVRVVPADQAGKEPFFWPAPGEGGCELYGYVPGQVAATELPGAKVAAVDVMIDGKRSGRTSAANGRPVTVDYCDLLSKDEQVPASVVVRLFDRTGKKLWSGTSVERITDPTAGWDLE
jgi:hypothetical protein